MLKGYQLTQTNIFKYQFMLPAGCFCLSCIVFLMLHPVCVTLSAVCWWSKATRLHTISFPSIIYEAGRLPLFTTHCFSLFHFGCAILGAVWWCVRATSLNKIQFLNLILCGWLAVSVCHLLLLEDSMCMHHSGTCLLVLKSYQFTQNFIFKFHFMKLAGCFGLPLVFSVWSKLPVSFWQLAAGAKSFQFTQNFFASHLMIVACRFSLLCVVIPCFKVSAPLWQLFAGA